MPILAELYVATRTRNTANADTENLPVLVVKRGSDIVFTKPLFGGDFRTARGAGAVWRFDVREVNLDSADLNIQLWASGDDAWSPEHVIAWGVSGRVGDERVIPLAAFLDLASPVTPAGSGVWISGDTSEGERILFVPSVGRGRDATRARRLIVISATDAYGGMFAAAAGPGGSFQDTGTVGPLTLQGGGAGRLLLSYTLPATPQGDLAHGAAAFYVVDLAAPFSRSDTRGWGVHAHHRIRRLVEARLLRGLRRRHGQRGAERPHPVRRRVRIRAAPDEQRSERGLAQRRAPDGEGAPAAPDPHRRRHR